MIEELLQLKRAITNLDELEAKQLLLILFMKADQRDGKQYEK